MNEQEWQEMEVLRQTVLLLFAAWEEIARQHGLELRQYLALWALHSTLRDPVYFPTTVTTLAHRMVRADNTTVELLDRLEAKGMVYRSKDLVDNRRKYVHLTEAGRQVVESAAPDQRRVVFRMGPSLIQALQALVDRNGEGEEGKGEEGETHNNST